MPTADAKLSAELKEGDARVDLKLLRHCQKETLSDVIVTYFRVIKQASEKRQLLAPVLEGLAK